MGLICGHHRRSERPDPQQDAPSSAGTPAVILAPASAHQAGSPPSAHRPARACVSRGEKAIAILSRQLHGHSVRDPRERHGA